jgi:predicted nucleotidyltransferase component of viral defense system
MAKILIPFQEKVLKEIGKSDLPRYFIWSGGTALSFYYLQHRRSQDLDFFSKDLIPADYLLTEIKRIAKNLKIQKIEEQKRFNRHEFWLTKGKEVLRIEFVFYPFPNIKKPKNLKNFNIRIDSLEDILTNKIHAIFERTEPKDVFDVYCVLQKKKIKLPLVLKWAKKKFGTEIDPVLLISKILEGVEKLTEIKPLILKREYYQINKIKIKEYFKTEAFNYLKGKIKQ